MAWPAVKKAILPSDFAASLDTIAGFTWKPAMIVLHNTAVPSLAQRPDGFTKSHMEALESYYKDKGWAGGPHYFIDDHVIWAFNPLTHRGTHSPSWNMTGIGIEMLGDFNKESFTSGRGYLVRANTIVAVAALSRKLGFDPDAWKFHVEDPRTDHDCPGIAARRDRVNIVREVTELMARDHSRPWDIPADDGEFKGTV